jgi:EAL domain-containing protein (putative c-di-GMP-specific phosphodiesterase class I)
MPTGEHRRRIVHRRHHPRAPGTGTARGHRRTAGALGLPIITEGVENAHQHAAVGPLGYRLAQGFYYGRPQTCAEIVDTISRGTSRAITPAE